MKLRFDYVNSFPRLVCEFNDEEGKEDEEVISRSFHETGIDQTGVASSCWKKAGGSEFVFISMLQRGQI